MNFGMLVEIIKSHHYAIFEQNELKGSKRKKLDFV